MVGSEFCILCSISVLMKHDVLQFAQLDVFCGNLQGKCRTFLPRLCASLRSRNAHGHVTRGILSRNLHGKCRTRIPQQTFCASLRSRNAHGHVTRGILCGNLHGKCRTRIPQQAFCANLRSRKCQTPRIPPRLNTGPEHLRCVDTLFGEKFHNYLKQPEGTC